MIDKKEIKNMYIQGKTVKEISIKTNVSKPYIYQIIKYYKLPKQKIFRTKVDIQQLKAFCENHNLDEIKAKWGTNGVRLMYKLGYGHKYKATTCKNKTRQIYNEIQEGTKSLSEIARDYGITRQRVWEIKQKFQKL